MNECYAYIRVSTAKQGEKGVSLQEQKAAIERYAAKNTLSIIEWFEERETAAKRGRREFGRMLSLLKKKRASGVIIHKIDRSARNLRDWADLGELIDQGIAVHFANESLDLASRGGRLSADIQAVVAADYIRNLREEARKGFYGRLKQGILPLQAPIGYLDEGAGKPKSIDPARGPLVRKAFELYATRQHNLHSLGKELARLGLTNRRGGKVTLSGLSMILNNPFYTGLIRVKKTGEVFEGIHKPILSRALFDEVQAILTGKTNTRTIKHDFLFRRRLNCALCKKRLIGERQKGYVYYRCQPRDCAMTCVREELVDGAVASVLENVAFTDEEHAYLMQKLEESEAGWRDESRQAAEEIKLRLGRVQARLIRLTDAFLDGTIDKEIFEERKSALLATKRELEEAQEQSSAAPEIHARKLRSLLELAHTASLSWKVGEKPERRELLDELTSNRVIGPEHASVELRFPYDLIADRNKLLSSVQEPNIDRTNSESATIAATNAKDKRHATLDRLLEGLRRWALNGIGPEESSSTSP